MFEISEGREKGKSGSRFGPLVVFGAHTYAKLTGFPKWSEHSDGWCTSPLKCFSHVQQVTGSSHMFLRSTNMEQFDVGRCLPHLGAHVE